MRRGALTVLLAGAAASTCRGRASLPAHPDAPVVPISIDTRRGVRAPAAEVQGRRDDKRGHGRMNYRVNQRLTECLRREWPTDQNVYDAAAWSAISGLSEQSMAEGSRPVAVPDFTRGRWKTTPPLLLRAA